MDTALENIWMYLNKCQNGYLNKCLNEIGGADVEKLLLISELVF